MVCNGDGGSSWLVCVAATRSTVFSCPCKIVEILCIATNIYYKKHRSLGWLICRIVDQEPEEILDSNRGALCLRQYLNCPRAEDHYLVYQPPSRLYMIYPVVVMLRHTIMERTPPSFRNSWATAILQVDMPYIKPANNT